MLGLLVKYATDHGISSEPGFARKQARWAAVFDAHGTFLDVVELGDTSQKKNPGQEFLRCPDLTQPELVGGKEERSHFLVETTQVVALYFKGDEDEKTRQKARAKHAFFVKLLRLAAREVPELSHLADSLDDDKTLDAISLRLLSLKARTADKMTMRVGDAFPVESDAWYDWWRGLRASLAASKTDREGGSRVTNRKVRCFVSGEPTAPLLTHPKISGLAEVGGLPTGDALVCFDKDSFTSYGLVQSANAAVSEQTAYAYREALNSLLREHAQRVVGAKIVHWFKGKVQPEDDPLSWLEEGPDTAELQAQARAAELLSAIRSGRRPDLAGNRFYALTLSGAAGRVMVRDWMEGEFEALMANVAAWFDDLAIVSRDGRGLAPSPKFLAVVGALVRDIKDAPSPFVTRMWRTAALHEPMPENALAQALRRATVEIVANQVANHARMGLMKAYHVRKGGSEMKPYLNEEHPHPAYHCGRLMAVLASIQHAALGDVGAGVVQRFYAAASSTPALVLGRLVRTSQFHLGKLEGGLAHWFDSKLAEVWGRIKDEVPQTLTLEEQSLFALGYYQQMAADRAQRSGANREREEEKSNG